MNPGYPLHAAEFLAFTCEAVSHSALICAKNAISPCFRYPAKRLCTSPIFGSLILCQWRHESVGLGNALTHGLETLVSSLDCINKQLVHPLVFEQVNAAVEKPDHDGIPFVCRGWHLI
jgi:hypothetical protein